MSNEGYCVVHEELQVVVGQCPEAYLGYNCLLVGTRLYLLLGPLALGDVAPDAHVTSDLAFLFLLPSQGNGDPFCVHWRAVLAIGHCFGAKPTPLGELPKSMGTLLLAKIARNNFKEITTQHLICPPAVHLLGTLVPGRHE